MTGIERGRKRRLRGLALVVVMASLGVGASALAASPKPIAAVDVKIPDKLLDLAVKKEDVAKSLPTGRTDVAADGMSLYSIRRGDNLLIATLQVVHFRPDTDPSSARFRTTFVDAIGSTSTEVVMMGTERVSITAAKGLTIAVWFRARDAFVLSIRSKDFNQPKSLLRQAFEQVTP
ncbi:MAG: hypothetical protein ABR598_02290 [Candidatus Dormibacteria bacterium]